jgi:hypothetical protein
MIQGQGQGNVGPNEAGKKVITIPVFDCNNL